MERSTKIGDITNVADALKASIEAAEMLIGLNKKFNTLFGSTLTEAQKENNNLLMMRDLSVILSMSNLEQLSNSIVTLYNIIIVTEKNPFKN